MTNTFLFIEEQIYFVCSLTKSLLNRVLNSKSRRKPSSLSSPTTIWRVKSYL